MATYDAALVRTVAIELQWRVRDLYMELLPLYSTMSAWTLNGTDPMLPAPFDVKVPLSSYQALVLKRLKLDEWVADLLKAVPGDTLTYPPPPAGGIVIFDETVIFSETLIF